MLARILNLAQTAEVFLARDGLDAALAMAASRSGTWFDPELVAALLSLRDDEGLVAALHCKSPRSMLRELDPEDRRTVADDATLDRIAAAFCHVVDAKSPWPAARALVVADMYEALAAHRPYRKDLDEGEVMAILSRNVLNGGICPAAFEALQSFLRRSNFVPYRIAA
jgi:hypothetical protein